MRKFRTNIILLLASGGCPLHRQLIRGISRAKRNKGKSDVSSEKQNINLKKFLRNGLHSKTSNSICTSLAVKYT